MNDGICSENRINRNVKYIKLWFETLDFVKKKTFETVDFVLNIN